VVRRAVKLAVERTPLAGHLLRREERRLSRLPSPPFSDGRPFPPAELMVRVAGTAGQEWFSKSGQAHAVKLGALAQAHGLDATAGNTVLDFGCGCGRIARWLASDVQAAGGRFIGGDFNPELVSWCAANLQGEYLGNGLRPPLSLPDASVDWLYAYSVLTHLTERVACQWLAEFSRVLRPGGLATVTFHDEAFAQVKAPPEVLPALRSTDYLVLNHALEGSNYMSAWTTAAYFRALASRWFDVLEIVSGDLDTQDQAVAVLRRPLSS